MSCGIIYVLSLSKKVARVKWLKLRFLLAPCPPSACCWLPPCRRRRNSGKKWQGNRVQLGLAAVIHALKPFYLNLLWVKKVNLKALWAAGKSPKLFQTHFCGEKFGFKFAEKDFFRVFEKIWGSTVIFERSPRSVFNHGCWGWAHQWHWKGMFTFVPDLEWK